MKTRQFKELCSVAISAELLKLGTRGAAEVILLNRKSERAVAAEEESPWFVSENSAMLSYLTQSEEEVGSEASE